MTGPTLCADATTDVAFFFNRVETDSGIGSDLGFSGGRSGSRHTTGPSVADRGVFPTRHASLEEELRRTIILSSFWELRQEVRDNLLRS